MLNIAIVNDTTIAVEVLRRAIQTNTNYRIMWIARNGEEAISQCKQQRPDLLLMDIHMPQLNGVKATKIIMEQCPCPILIVTASVSKNSSEVFEAMGYGALDVVKTPAFKASNNDYKSLLHKMEIVAKLKSPSIQTSTTSHHLNLRSNAGVSPITPDLPPLIIIGSSTGGPNALSTILEALPHNFPWAIVIAQHIDSQFVDGFVSWLERFSNLPIALAQPGDRPQAGKVLVAQTHNHIIMRPNLTLRYTSEPVNDPNRPSISTFFKSVALHWPKPGTAILLTGMGRDGGIGMKDLYDANWKTIAQDEASCVVYGMPKAAVELKAVRKSLSPDAIANELKLDRYQWLR